MRFKIIMINDLDNIHEETVIANNEQEEMAVQTFNPKSKILESGWIYKY